MFYTGALHTYFRLSTSSGSTTQGLITQVYFHPVKREVTVNLLRTHRHFFFFFGGISNLESMVKLQFQISILHDLHGKGDRKLLHIAWKIKLFMELPLVSQIANFFLMKIYHVLFDYFLFPVLNALRLSYSITLSFEYSLRMLEQLASSFKVTDN